MKAPKEHEKYLAKKDYSFECSSIIFEPQERKFLKKYGYWIEALVTGKISPITEAEQRLIEVHAGKIEPINFQEKAWWKLIERRTFEKDRKNSPHFKIIDKAEQFFSRTGWNEMRKRKNI